MIQRDAQKQDFSRPEPLNIAGVVSSLTQGSSVHLTKPIQVIYLAFLGPSRGAKMLYKIKFTSFNELMREANFATC